MEDYAGTEFKNLLHVIQAEPQSGESIRILALEIYDIGLAIRWMLPSGPGPQPKTAEEAGLNPLGFMSLTLRDGLGTPYERTMMFAGSAQGVDFFKPAIPAEADYLEVLVTDGFVRFVLRPG